MNEYETVTISTARFVELLRAERDAKDFRTTLDMIEDLLVNEGKVVADQPAFGSMAVQRIADIIRYRCPEEYSEVEAVIMERRRKQETIMERRPKHGE